MSAFWLVSVAEHVIFSVRQKFWELKTIVSLDVLLVCQNVGYS